MSEFLREEDISAGFRAPLYCVDVCIPECNVCVYWKGPGKCEKFGESPYDFSRGKRHNCPDAILNTDHFSYPKYEELYPEECKVSAKNKAI